MQEEGSLLPHTGSLNLTACKSSNYMVQTDQTNQTDETIKNDKTI